MPRSVVFRIERDAARCHIGAQQGFGGQAGGAGFHVRLVGAGQGERRDRLVADVQLHQRGTPVSPLPEVGVERNAGELAFEVLRVLLAVQRVVQHGVAVVKDLFFADSRLYRNGLFSTLKSWSWPRGFEVQFGGGVVVGGELLEGPVGDVVYELSIWVEAA